MKAFPYTILAYLMPLFSSAMLVTACNSEHLVSPSRVLALSAGGQLAYSPSALRFGEQTARLRLKIRNAGTSRLTWRARSLDGWVDLPESGRIRAGETEAIPVRVSRANLAPGAYRTTIRLRSDAGLQSIPVTLQVGADSESSIPPALGSIDATGATDVTEPLNAYLAGLPDGSVVTFPAQARYRVEGVLRLGAGLRPPRHRAATHRRMPRPVRRAPIHH